MVATSSVKSLSAPWLIRLWWEEIATLIVCVGLDFVEYLFPPLLTPLLGDIFDLAGVVFCVFFFRWLGFISILELIPGIDVLPLFTATWLIWYLIKRRGDRSRMEYELERWR